MPKNQFQRSAPVAHTKQVPRHGAPVPAPKAEMPRRQQSRAESSGLPPLATLLKSAK